MRYRLLLLVSFMFTSCGKRFITVDKHPEIPVLPKHTNKNIDIKLFASMERWFINKKYLYGIGEDTLTNSGKGLVIYDKKFKLFKFIKEESKKINFFSNSDGDIYIYTYKNGMIDRAYKVDATPLNKKYLDIERIPHVYMSDEYILKKYKKEIHYKEGDIGYSDIMSKMKTRELLSHPEDYPKIYPIVKKMKKNLKCINRKPDSSKHVYWSFLFEYSDRDVIVNTLNIDFFSDISNCKNSSTYNKVIVAKEFDNAVIRNVKANRFFYTTFEYDYIKLQLGSEVFKTKIGVYGGKPRLYIVYQDDDKIILQYRNDYFDITQYFMVTKK